jgi:hypothetical protein
MKKVPLSLLIFLMVGASGAANAQSMRERVQDNIDAMPSIEGIFTQENVENTVVPYETNRPPEADYNHNDFDRLELEQQYQDDATGQAWTTMKDSATGRPSIDLGDDPLSLADDAVEQADSVVGGLFSSGGGVCSDEFQGGSFQGTQFCRKILSRTYESCQQDRVISVDREDDWQCSTETRNYRKNCTRNVNWVCSGTTGATCRKSKVIVSSATNSWNSAGTDITVTMPVRSNGTCNIKTDTFYVQARQGVNLSTLELSRLRFNGVAQIKVNGSIVWTYSKSGGDLNVRDRDCGKNCTAKAIYAGSTWVEDCTSSRRDQYPRHSIRTAVNVPNIGPSTENGTTITLPLSGVSNNLRIDVVRGNTSESATYMNIGVNGSCCSAFSGTVEGSC